jgi:uncharacterized integral membrane protein
MWTGALLISCVGLFVAINCRSFYYHRDFQIAAASIVSLIGLVTIALILSVRKQNVHNVHINYKKGTFRSAIILSLIFFLFFITGIAINHCWRDGIIFAFASVAVIWAIYAALFYVITPVIRWIGKGFKDIQQ